MTWNEKLFVSKLNDWYQWYLTKEGVQRYTINSLFYITMMREKYVQMYEKNYQSIKDICQCSKNSFEGLCANFSVQ